MKFIINSSLGCVNIKYYNENNEIIKEIRINQRNFKNFNLQNNLYNELYIHILLKLKYDDIKKNKDKFIKFKENGYRVEIGYNIDYLLNLGIKDIKDIYEKHQRFYDHEEFERYFSTDIYGLYLNDLSYLVDYITNHQKQFEHDKKQLGVIE